MQSTTSLPTLSRSLSLTTTGAFWSFFGRLTLIPWSIFGFLALEVRLSIKRQGLFASLLFQKIGIEENKFDKSRLENVLYFSCLLTQSVILHLFISYFGPKKGILAPNIFGEVARILFWNVNLSERLFCPFRWRKCAHVHKCPVLFLLISMCRTMFRDSRAITCL